MGGTNHCVDMHVLVSMSEIRFLCFKTGFRPKKLHVLTYVRRLYP